MSNSPKPRGSSSDDKAATRAAESNDAGNQNRQPARKAQEEMRSEGAGSINVKWSQERRLQFIDFRLQWERRINRRDVTDFFKISVPQASADISKYAEMAPDNLEYDASSRTYIATANFVALFESSGPNQYLSQLLALERRVVADDQTFLLSHPPVEAVPLPSRTIDPEILALMLRAIAESLMLEIEYQSITRDEERSRYISPHAFGYDGGRWHVRAYCHLREGFRDFVFGRILSAGRIKTSHIDSANDIEWNTNVPLVLTPHPMLTREQRAGVEVDYGMKGGTVTIMCRQAMLFYTLRTLNFELNGLPRALERQVVIANLEEIEPFLPKPGQA